MRFSNIFALALMGGISSAAFSQDSFLGQPAPEELLAPAPEQIIPEAAPTVVPGKTYLAPVSCTKKEIVDVYTITGLEQCGTQIRNSRLAGVINRLKNPCADEFLVATVYASKKHCEDCSSVKAAKELRLRRLEGVPCADICLEEGYIEQLTQNLTSLSRRVRLQSIIGLRSCGYKVVHSTACVDVQIPAILAAPSEQP